MSTKNLFLSFCSTAALIGTCGATTVANAHGPLEVLQTAEMIELEAF